MMKPLISLLSLAFLFILTLSLPIRGACQARNVTCADIKTGIFYYYPKNSASHYISNRSEKYVNEKDAVTGDSTVWEINWIDDCTYALKFVSSTSKVDEGTLKIIQHYKLVYKINSITNDYYTFKGYIDKTTNIPISDDTIWTSEKVVIPDTRLFQKVANQGIIKKDHFSDTSRYALLYVYRPRKFTNSANNYLLYFNETPMCVVQNGQGFIFKIFKEGLAEIKSRLHKDESGVKLDIKFGNIYYVKSMVHWTITKRMDVFKLDMQVMKPEEGQDEFLNADLQ